VSIAVALADKLDQLVGFFAIGERPSGAGDPYALRRAALGIIRIVRENDIRIALLPLIDLAGQGFHHHGVHPIPARDVLDFLAERLRVQLRAEGKRYDVLAAVFAAGADDNIPRLLSRTDAVASLLASDNGTNLLTAYRRAANILRIEARKDGPHDGTLSAAAMRTVEEHGLLRAATHADAYITGLLRDDDYETALGVLADLRSPLDAFFDKVTVNAPEPDLRLNRLRLLHKVRSTMDRIADFSKIEG
jgi:glycyl-tRNA synthetase beta chain